jgi:hypothetical protein
MARHKNANAYTRNSSKLLKPMLSKAITSQLSFRKEQRKTYKVVFLEDGLLNVAKTPRYLVGV